MVTACPKCGKKAWKPYKFVIKGKSGKNYAYLVYRHNEKKRHTRTERTDDVRLNYSGVVIA